MKRFSVVVTVLNEHDSIVPLLDSLLNQDLRVDELVIVDGGSRDGTIQTIKEWQNLHLNFPLVLLRAPGANRSVGRNMGVHTAKHEIILVTDAGCVPNNDWTQALVKHFDDTKAGAVAGFYTMESNNLLSEIFSWYLGTLPDRLDTETFLPSSRSLAFTKDAFVRVGGYPKHLSTCEDLIFAALLKKKTKMVVEKQALVRWAMPATYAAFMKQVSGYAKGDVEAVYWPHIWRIASVWLRYLVFVFLPPSFFLYAMYPLIKWRKRLKPGMMYQVIAVQISADLAVIWGSARGWLRR